VVSTNQDIFSPFYFVMMALFLASSMAMAPSSVAQTAEDTVSLEDEYFETVFTDPTNLIINFKLAGAQIDNGNIKGAIGTLERVLTFVPNNNEAQFLIASAYLQIGNTAESRRMFTLLLNNPAASDVEIEQAQNILAKLDRQDQRFIFSGSVSVGGGLSDNPQGGSVGNLSQVNGNVITNGANFTKRATTEEFTAASAQINLQRQLESQDDESLTFSLSSSIKDFAHYNDGDFARLGLSTRYVKTLENSFGKGTLNTSLSVNRVDIDDKHYLNDYGASANYSQTIAKRWNMGGNVNVSRLVFNKDFSTNASLKTAFNKSISIRLARAFKAVQVGGRYSYLNSAAKTEYNSRYTHSGGVFASTSIVPGLISAGLDFVQTRYKAPEVIYGDARRDDFSRFVNLNYIIGLSSLNIPVGNETRVNIASRYGKTKSNIANFTKYSGEISVNFIKPF
jgi:hypothetical protein